MLIAYHNNPAEKRAILEQLAAHRAADQLVKGQYWENGKGCAVGCTLHSGDHLEYEQRFGIPVMLACLEDRIFEGMPDADAQQWPERFMSAIIPGTDLSRVGWQFLHWLLTDETVNPGISHALVRDAVRECANLLLPLTRGELISLDAVESARNAQRAAWSAVPSAALGAAESAVESAAWSAVPSAAWSAVESALGAESAAWSRMANKLIDLIQQTTSVD